MLISSPSIIFCACTEVQFLSLEQNTCAAQQQVVDPWIVLGVSLCCLTLAWLVSPTQLPAANQLTFWRVTKPISKAVVLRCRAGSLTAARAGLHLPSECTPVCLPGPATARPSHAPAPLLACSLLTPCCIDQTPSHQRNAGVQPGAALCYSLAGGIVLILCAWLGSDFIPCPTTTPRHVWTSEGKGRERAPGPASDRDLLTRFCGCRPTLTRMQKRLALQSRAVRCRRWSQYPLKGYSKLMPG